jgi:alkanesulfonate monooxygenase SsuD/methylene tetrahydromethanopterin reductase-like flavin-dependent oxidoreductase (luciferase family)
MSTAKPHPLRGPNKFKLGVFSANADGGLALTTVPERWRAAWDDIVAAARLADRAGLEMFLPIARWKGFGGQTQAREWSFETLTFAAALAGQTERIAVFSTVHVPLVHPVFAAKALATVDHASHGRAGLNIVCGWNPDEFGMFGVKVPDDRYAQGEEWWSLVRRIHAGEGPFDFDGRFYSLRKVAGRPRPLQASIVTVNAAFGPPGRDFAAKNCDFLLTVFTDYDAAARHLEDIQSRARKFGRDVGVLATCHAVVRDTQAQAEAYYRHYALEHADADAVDYHMAQKKEFASSHDPVTFTQYKQRFAGGAGTFPLVGSPEHVAEEVRRIHACGYAGAAISFVDYRDDVRIFCERIVPLLEKMGLRAPA